MNLNKAFILGNLTRDPERRSLPSGRPVVSFGVATNRFFSSPEKGKQQETEFHNITVFGRLAEIASQYLQKGSMVFVEGRIRTRNWQDAQGIKHFRTEIIADNIQLGPRLKNQLNSQGTKIAKNEVPDEDIPVIEENPGKRAEEQSTESLEEPNEEEIDVKEIPF